MTLKGVILSMLGTKRIPAHKLVDMIAGQRHAAEGSIRTTLSLMVRGKEIISEKYVCRECGNVTVTYRRKK